jgi:hypothetical protein
MEFSERKNQTLIYSSTVFQFILFIISYLRREISAYFEFIHCNSELIPSLPKNFLIRWLDLKLNRAYSQLFINDSEIQTLSLINNEFQMYWSALVQTPVENT